MQNSVSHIGIIMDGNRRWSKKQSLLLKNGYTKGADALKEAIIGCIHNNISYLSVYAFSSENWNREKDEISLLSNLLNIYLTKEELFFIENEVKLQVIGDFTKFGDSISNKILSLEKKTQGFTKLTLIIALNYGARQEILRATTNITKDILLQKITLSDITEDLFTSYLYTKNIPNPDLIIRTGGEQRISNFMLWQIAYTELIFFDFMWPQFTKNNIEDALNIYNSRNRREGR